MLNKHLIVKTQPKPNSQNLVFWENYRITVLGDRLFRIEQNDNLQFLDQATQVIWFRNAPKQKFTILKGKTNLTIITDKCKLKIEKNREKCKVYVGNKWKAVNNRFNLKGTCRTLDACDGNEIFVKNPPELISLGNGVCSTSGVAVLDDSNSLCLTDTGMIYPRKSKETDEYVFAFGNDYRSAVCALFEITGKTPVVPRFALGNWWSRYRKYTHQEYMQVLQRFEDNEVPLTVATIDMDWHYSDSVDQQMQIKEQGKNTEFFGCHHSGVGPDGNGWTGYTWNKELFPNYKKFLKEIKERNLKITLNFC